MMTQADQCPRCGGLTVTEQVTTEEQLQPTLTAPTKRWWAHKEEPAVVLRVGVFQRRCLCCGGVQF
jgi:hypothetical protein